jgi:sulfate adenylyltransferase
MKDDLVSRVLSGREKELILKKPYKKITLNYDSVLDLANIAHGVYSPIEGFMDRRDFNSVLSRMRLENGQPWTIPICLIASNEDSRGLSRGETAFLCQEDGRKVGLIEIEDIFSINRNIWAKKVFGTERREHPGVRKVFESTAKAIGGKVWLIEEPKFAFHEYNLSPIEVRRIKEERGWQTMAGFQTRNIPHRAHEYQQKLALQIADGLLIHPIIGWKKDGDFRPEVIIDAYKVLIEKYFPRKRVIFSGLATAMRYAGPREAVFHAIIRKNYGCTHFIVGRDHAGVGGFYDKYDAHRIFERLPDLGITPLLLREPYYCRRCQEMVSDKICPHGPKWHEKISGTQIRECLGKGADIPEHVIRKEVLGVLRNKGKGIFL